MSDQPKPKRTLPKPVIIAIALLVVGGGITAALLASGRGGGSSGGSSDKVKIEVRAVPVAKIRFRGKNLGDTPLTLYLPRSKEPVTFEATFTNHLVNLKTKEPKKKYLQQVKSIVPDAEQSVDFFVKDAEEVEPDPVSGSK